MVIKNNALTADEKLHLLTPFLDEMEKMQALPAEIKARIASEFNIVQAAKDDIILSEGETCKHLWVVLTGVIRSFHYVGETEVTSSFMKPHHIIISIESFHTQTPAFESLQALQPSMLACLHYRQLEELYRQFPMLNLMGRKLTEHYLFLLEKRLYLLRKQKALDKYKYFLEYYPELINEIPLKYIASYLGINGETLSRIRNKIR